MGPPLFENDFLNNNNNQQQENVIAKFFRRAHPSTSTFTGDQLSENPLQKYHIKPNLHRAIFGRSSAVAGSINEFYSQALNQRPEFWSLVTENFSVDIRLYLEWQENANSFTKCMEFRFVFAQRIPCLQGRMDSNYWRKCKMQPSNNKDNCAGC